MFCLWISLLVCPTISNAAAGLHDPPPAPGYNAYRVVGDPTNILSTPPEETIANHTEEFLAAEYDLVRTRDEQFFSSQGHQLFKVPNRGRTRVDWTGYAADVGQVLLSHWEGNAFYSVFLAEALTNGTHSVTVSRSEAETSLYLLIWGSNGELLTDAFEATLIDPDEWSVAVDAPELIFTSGGDLPWVVQEAEVQDGPTAPGSMV